jgi:DNA-binding winged helix-turn-helix (wHTH) protein
VAYAVPSGDKVSVKLGGVQLLAPETGSVIRSASYEADLESGELRKQGTRVRLQGQPFQVLAILLKRAGEIVTREELRRSVWPQDTFVDFDHALNTAVKKIRAALSDDADNPRFITTVPRRGYRFIATVEPNVPSDLRSRPAIEDIAVLRSPYRALAILGIAALVLAAAGLAWKVVPWSHATQSRIPDFERLTFDVSELGYARFTSDGATVVYTTGWLRHKGRDLCPARWHGASSGVGHSKR